MARTQRIEVAILGHRYPVRTEATAAARERVEAAAQRVGEEMQRIQSATHEVEPRHLAVMAALALADALLETEARLEGLETDAAAFRAAVRARGEQLLALVERELARLSRADEEAPAWAGDGADSGL